MPELPEVETVRRMLERHVVGRTVASVRLSGKRLRTAVPRSIGARLRRRTIESMGRHGKYLLFDLDSGLTLLSHLGMSGRWLFHERPPAEFPSHVHVRLEFRDGTQLWFQDPRRFGVVKLVRTDRLFRDPMLAILGPDPVLTPLTGTALHALARGATVAVKNFLLDQRRMAGIGNIYASEILHRAAVDPRRRAGSLTHAEWDAIGVEITHVLGAAIARMGTTFSTFRTLSNEPGSYGDQLLVYDRAREPCRRCGTLIRRIVQGQRSTYFCPACQGSGSRRTSGTPYAPASTSGAARRRTRDR